MKIRVKLLFDDGVWFVDLPTYSMVPNSFSPIVANKVTANGILPNVLPNDPKLRRISCEVEVPDNIVDQKTGQIDVAAIRRIYARQPRWDSPSGRVPDVIPEAAI